jgi:hypothetical protein
LKAKANDHSHWAYKVKAKVSGRPEVRVVIETAQGNLDRLQSVGGQPILENQAQRQEQRIRRLVGNRDAQRKLERAQAVDDRRTEHLFRVLPDAVFASYGARASHEDAVFHATEGDIWIQGDRLAEIEGHLIRPVKFGCGWLGHLDQGGEFRAQQSEVAPGHWEITLLHVNLHGKALFFRTIGVQQNEVRYRRATRKADNREGCNREGQMVCPATGSRAYGAIDAELRRPASREQQEFLGAAFEVSRYVVVSAPREPDPGCTPH